MRTVFRILRKQAAFIKRGYLVESSYKFAFVMGLMTSIVPVVLFFFVGKLLDNHASTALKPYGGRYFPFALVGVGLSQFLSKALNIFSASMRRAQMSGVLEATLSSQTQPVALIIYDSAYSFLMASTELLLVFVVGAWLMGASFAAANVASVVLVALTSLGTFVAFGILSATAVIVLKKGDPVAFIFGSGAAVLSGAYFPISVMPQAVQRFSACLPMTHALHALRRALFAGASVSELWKSVFILGMFAVVLLPASLVAFRWAVEKGRREGTLLHY